MKEYNQGVFFGERALYNTKDAIINDSIFEDGESPLKESSNVTLCGAIFKWKYPLWYCKSVGVYDSTILETARSGIWYTEDITLKGCTVDAPKTFRRCSGINVIKCTFSAGAETLWNCKDISIEDTSVVGDYFGMGCENVRIKRFSISGNYLLDGAKNIEITDSKLISKDAFWNCENVIVKNCVIIGEYLGWNSKNVKFIDCTIESNQGLCYMDGVVLENCKLINTDLAFEFSNVKADIISHIESVKNPHSGHIKAKSIGEIILDDTLVDTKKVKIETEE